MIGQPLLLLGLASLLRVKAPGRAGGVLAGLLPQAGADKGWGCQRWANEACWSGLVLAWPVIVAAMLRILMGGILRRAENGRRERRG